MLEFSHEKICKNKGICGIVIPSEKYKTEFYQYTKSDEMLHIYIYIYILADIKLIREKAEELIVKMHRWANNPVRFSTTKIGEHIPCGYSMSTILGFDHMENKHTLSLGKNCIKKFCTSLREHGKKKTHNWFWK